MEIHIVQGLNDALVSDLEKSFGKTVARDEHGALFKPDAKGAVADLHKLSRKHSVTIECTQHPPGAIVKLRTGEYELGSDNVWAKRG